MSDYAVVFTSGIPYGQPPVGRSGRFMPARPLTQPWDGVLNATVDHAACWQLGDSFDIPQSEDCLYLNVFTTPAALSNASAARLPVLFWLYGGSLIVRDRVSKRVPLSSQP